MVSQYDKNTLFLSRWDDESLAEITALDNRAFFKRTADGVEFDIALDRRPKTNRFDYRVKGKNLKFHYQPPLTESEIAAGFSRDENTVGSYAVYHPTKSGHNLNGGKNYESGKVFHVFRPKAVDKNGEWSWARLRFENDLLSVIVDPAFLRKAAYPVIVDPEFGNHSDGSATYVGGKNIIGGFLFALSAAGTATSIFGRVFRSAGGNMQLGIYDTATSKNLKAKTGTAALPAAADWTEIAVSWAEEMTAANYWICYNFDTTNTSIRYDTTTDYLWYKSQTYGTWPDPSADWTQFNQYKLCLYCVYTASGGVINNQLCMII